MNRDEVMMGMTNEQLCDCVAKLIDWKPDKLCIDGGESATDCIEGQYKDDDCTVLSDAGSWKTCMYGMPSPRPDWPNDIAAAMEFVPLLIAEGYSVELSCWMTGVRYVAQCVAKRSDGDWDASATSLDNMDGLAPRAITKAFIMAMEAE